MQACLFDYNLLPIVSQRTGQVVVLFMCVSATPGAVITHFIALLVKLAGINPCYVSSLDARIGLSTGATYSNDWV